MKLAFYKAKHGNWQDKAIAFWTRSKYSHVELVLPAGLSFTASNRDNLVRTKTILYREGKWDFLDIPDHVDANQMYTRIREVSGSKYDWVGIFLHQFLPLNIDSKRKWWCSEVIAYVLGIEDFKVDPGELYDIMKKEQV